MIVAYYGGPNDRVFGRVKFSCMETALVECYTSSCHWGLHDTEVERTAADRLWDGQSPEAKGAQFTSTNRQRDAIQVSLFD